MADDEMRAMDIGCLQTEGIIFLWVTGRAMELGRECLSLWGYRYVQDLVWVKTNQVPLRLYPLSLRFGPALRFTRQNAHFCMTRLVACLLITKTAERGAIRR